MPRLNAWFAASALVLTAAAAAAAGGQASGRPERSRPSDPPWASEHSMHAYFVDRFEASDGLGFRRTAGPLMTLNDAMTVTINTPLDEGSAPDSREYRVEAFELIGVAKRATPVALVMRRHRSNVLPATPGATAPAEFESRPLTTFERSALSRLQKGEDVVVQPGQDTLSVAGAVRATQFCVGCHAGYAEGDVLGALSYHLTLIKKQ